MVISIHRALVFCAVLASMGPARAQQETLGFCFNEWAPYATEIDGVPAGISIDILREAVRRAGMVGEFLELPWNRCLEMVRSGELDAVIDAAERPEFLQGPTSFSLYSNTIWVNEKAPEGVHGFKDLGSRTIGLIDGYVYPESLTADIAAAGLKVEYSVDDETNLRKLAFGRVDAIIGDLVSTAVLVREKGITNLRPILPSHSADRLYPSFGADRKAAQAAIDSALAAMMQDGFIDSVYERHIGLRFSDFGKP